MFNSLILPDQNNDFEMEKRMKKQGKRWELLLRCLMLESEFHPLKTEEVFVCLFLLDELIYELWDPVCFFFKLFFSHLSP